MQSVGQDRTGRAASGTSPQLLRRVNAEALLAVLRDSDVMTVTELMSRTGLTRSTVLAICEDLIGAGWALELENQREAGGYVKGRPARRFVFNRHAGHVLGIDVGVTKVTAVVADLRGTSRARVTVPCDANAVPPAERLAIIDRAALSALSRVKLEPTSVLAASIGVPAPVSRHGEICPGDHPFWRLFDIGLPTWLEDRHGWRVQLENDANLAALAEQWQGAAQGVDDYVTLLASERFGAGIVENGNLLHGHRGGSGEMEFLRLLDGVGDPGGIADLARRWAAELVTTNPDQMSAQCPASHTSTDAVTAEMVFAAAADHDAAAQTIVDRVAGRLARVVASFSGLMNPELVVISGAVAESASALLDDVGRQLAELTLLPPRLAASTLGDAVVAVGAVRHALDFVARNTLDLDLRAR